MSQAAQPSEMAEILSSIPPDKFEEAIDFLFNQGGTLAQIRGLTDEDLEGLYSIGYSEYGQKNYERAESMFQFLCMFDHLKPKFWLGLGMSRQKLGKYEAAVQALVLAALHDVNDPRAPLLAGECLMALGKLDNAERALATAAHLAAQDEQHVKLKSHAEALLAAVEHRKESEGESKAES